MSKKLVGGDYLLDLSSIEIEQSEDGETYTNITDASVLEQLTNLKRYVPNPQMAKPVWIKLKNGENDELVVARGTFANVGTGEFEICVQLNGYKLIISIEFTQALNEDNEPIDDWYIAENDAKYLFTSDAQNIGAISELPVFENIVDAQGHKRFVEGDVLPAGDLPTGITKLYGKWSLSGSHLIVVISYSIANETQLTAYTDFGKLVGIPEWVYDKIIPLFAGNIVVQQVVNAYDNVAGVQQINMRLYKTLETHTLDLTNVSTFTLTANRTFRWQIDLLIDNDASESQGE